MLYHLEVGDTKREPTGGDLKEAVKEFGKPMPAFTIPVKINEIFYDFAFGGNQRLVLHIGCKEWEPTVEERDEIRAKFEEALLQPLGTPAVVATRFGVRVTLLDDYYYTPPEAPITEGL